MRWGIVGKLVLLLAAVGFLAAGLTGFYAYQASRNLLVDSAKNKLLTSTQVLARRITQTREEVSRNLQVLAGLPITISILQHQDWDDTEQLAKLFGLLIDANPSYLQLRLISASDYGLERVRVERVGPSTLRVQGDDLQEKGHYAYVFDTLKLPARATYMSRITINHEGGSYAGLEQPTLQLAMPVMDANNTAIGVVVVNMDLNGMFNLLAADLPPTFKLFLANAEGDILVHPDSSKTFGFDKGRRVLLQDEFEPLRPLISGQQEHVVFEAREDGYADAPVVAAFIAAKVHVSSSETRLLLGLAQPLDQVLAQSQQLGSTILQIVVGLSMLCLLLAVPLARAMTRPINAVTAAAQRFANGLPPGDLPLLRRDEIGSLARSFHQMHLQITGQLADLHDNQEELEHLAQHDMLTGLPNRRLFQERLEKALAHARRYGEQVCLLFIDLDAFKAINDGYGHDAGDEVLKTVARRMQHMVREVDTVARLGGDEFVVLLGAAVSHSHLATIAGKLLTAIQEPIPVQAQELRVTASIGISRYPQDGQTAADILATADQAMYSAKLAGRAGYRFFSASVE
ncbi:diguanylate cyclase [Rhodoferax sp.]|uniref:diguanylate cyclase domain-containing protein n=1 Tax=Rhodoferax sp. TaxID=50421 RepID=UPI0025DCFEC6|nr:diguanylate cyclase [Rhodoferax sp.]